MEDNETMQLHTVERHVISPKEFRPAGYTEAPPHNAIKAVWHLKTIKCFPIPRDLSIWNPPYVFIPLNRYLPLMPSYCGVTLRCERRSAAWLYSVCVYCCRFRAASEGPCRLAAFCSCCVLLDVFCRSRRCISMTLMQCEAFWKCAMEKKIRIFPVYVKQKR